jgi:hypothetical protein
MATVPENAVYVLWFFETKFIIKMQRRYGNQYGKDQPLDNFIRRWLKQFQETGKFVAAIETVAPPMLENTWREIRHHTCYERHTFRSYF